MPKTFLEPAGNHVLVVDRDRTTTIDGITLPDSVRQQSMVYGFVVSVGPLARERVKEKDIVAYGPYAGKEVVLEGTEFRIIKEEQIEAWVRTSPQEVWPGAMLQEETYSHD